MTQFVKNQKNGHTPPVYYKIFSIEYKNVVVLDCVGALGV